MDATLSPWGTFRHLLQRWQQLADGSRRPADLARALIAFFRERVLLAAACIAGISAAAGALGMYWLIGSDLPALRAEFRKVATELYLFHTDLNVADARQRSALSEHLLEEKASRDAVLSSLHALSVNSILLMQKAERRALKPQEVKHLLASVREISLAEAAKLESIATIGGVISEHSMPLLAFAKQQEDLKEVASFFNAAMPSVRPAYLGKLLLTRHGTWQAGDRHLLFKWDGGSAKLRARKDLAQGEIIRTAEFLNSVSLALGQATLVVPRAVAPNPLVGRRPAAASRSSGASTSARRAQAPRRIPVLQRAPKGAEKRAGTRSLVR